MTATRIILNNRNFVLVPEADWVKVASARVQPARVPAARTRKERREAVEARRGILPPLPPPDEKGNRPALAFADVAIARAIISRRKRMGLSQIGLANLAGVRVEVLNRAERAVTVPSVRTLMKIEAVLHDLERRAGAKRRRSA